MTAVLIFVFKDPILGFAASIQLAANKMVKPGDWITVPKFGIDGTVEDISLTTVKIRNWDMTITTIPTYSLVSEPVINWIGMSESGGRRIKRSVRIDLTSIRVCDEALMRKIKNSPLLNDLVSLNNSENQTLKSKDSKKALIASVHGTITNLSLFKEYLQGYCNEHPGIHSNMARLVRFLQSDEKGLPVEIIFFSKYSDMNVYESLQAEIFNHIFAILPEFELRIYQDPVVSISQ
jgi:miniconductance mechanosensitive channel